MKFLQPEFLFGLFAIAIPIIIHLFQFRKAKKIYFSNTRFIQEVKKTTSSKRRLKHLLILASRILFILFLVLAFAQPIIPSKTGSQSAENVYFYIDNSLSMTNSMEDGTTGLDAALATVEKLINIYPANTNFKILTNDFAPFSNALKSRDEVRELLTEVRRSYISRSFEEVYHRLVTELPGEQSGKRELYFISDFQKSTFGSDLPAIDSLHQLYFIPKVFPEYQNVYIDSVYLDNPFLMGDQANKLHIQLRNIGTDEMEDMGLKLFVNNIQASSATITIAANDITPLEVELSMPLEKINKVRIEIEEFPVTFDNEFLLVLNKSDRIKITEIKASDKISPIELVFGNTELFNFNSQHVSNIDYSQISQADLVVVNQLDQVEKSLLETFKSFVIDNGAIIIIPGENMVLNDLQELAGISIVSSTMNEPEFLSPPKTDNPFFDNIFDGLEGNLQMPLALSLIEWTENRRTILKHKDNKNYLSEIRPGVFLFAAPIDEKFGTFARHALFVPVMYRMAAASKDISNDLYHVATDAAIFLKLDSLNPKAVYKLSAPESEIIPGQNISGNQLILQMPKYTLQKSFYDLYDKDNYLTTIALNIDKKESMLDAFSQEELETHFTDFNNISIFNAPDSKKAESEIRKLKFGTPLWKYALILSLLFLLCEVLLIRFFK